MFASLCKCVLRMHLELRRINIRNVLISGDCCQVKWGSAMQDNTVLPATVWILPVRSEHKPCRPTQAFVVVRGRTYYAKQSNQM